MTTIARYFFWLLIMLLVACSKANDGQNNKAPRPNVIFIMADDHANRAISAYKSRLNSTPNIDRIANEGAIFLNSFCANSICGPSRASILTGKHSHKNGIVGNASPWDADQQVFSRIMQDSGYQTALIGKWHLNSLPGGAFNYWNVLTGAGKQGFYYNPSFINKDSVEQTVEGYSTDIITDQSLDWLNTHSQQEKPFMLFVQFKAPHVPRMPAFRFLGKYKNDSIAEPATLFDDYETRAPYAEAANMKVGLNLPPVMEEHDKASNIYYDRMTEEQFKKWHSYKDPIIRKYQALLADGSPERTVKKFVYQQFIKDYLRVVDGVDENVGRVLEWLDEHNDIKENTIVIYCGDQSYFTGEHGWAEKRFMYEEGMKMPFLIRWPGQIKPGSRIGSMIQNIDYGPTLLEATGIAIPDDMQGRSFLPILKGETPENWRKAVYYHYYDHGRHNVPRHEGVRNDQYKLIHFYTDDVWEFYDLEQDPHEINNVYGKSDYGSIINQMKEDMLRLRKQYEVPEDHFEAPYVESGKNQEI